MTQYIDKSALVAELNRLIAELVEEGEDTMFEQGRISAFEDVKVFINHTLEVKEVGEEPVSNDLEEAADKHLVEKGYLLTTKNGEHLAEVEAKGLFKAGAQWQKEQMVKEVDLEGISKNYALNNSPWDDCMLEMQNAFKDGFELGLKVQKGE